MFILSFFIVFVYLAVILPIPCLIPLWDSAAADTPSGKELNSSSQEDARFSEHCTLANNFDFILRHSFLGLNNSSLILWQRTQPFLSGRCLFFRALHLGMQISLYPVLSLFGNQWQLTYPTVKSSSLTLWTNHVSQGLSHIILTGLFLVWCSLILLIKSIYAFILWSISIANDRHYPKYFILCVVYFYSKRPPHCSGV